MPYFGLHTEKLNLTNILLIEINKIFNLGGLIVSSFWVIPSKMYSTIKAVMQLFKRALSIYFVWSNIKIYHTIII